MWRARSNDRNWPDAGLMTTGSGRPEAGVRHTTGSLSLAEGIPLAPSGIGDLYGLTR